MKVKHRVECPVCGSEMHESFYGSCRFFECSECCDVCSGYEIRIRLTERQVRRMRHWRRTA